MAKLFLDANCFIDLIEDRNSELIVFLEKHELAISVLSLHILIYVYKYKIPNKKLQLIPQRFEILPITKSISLDSLQEPTNDYEDNIQLQTAVKHGFDIFLTNDKAPLKLSEFRKIKIITPEEIIRDN